MSSSSFGTGNDAVAQSKTSMAGGSGIGRWKFSARYRSRNSSTSEGVLACERAVAIGVAGGSLSGNIVPRLSVCEQRDRGET